MREPTATAASGAAGSGPHPGACPDPGAGPPETHGEDAVKARLAEEIARVVRARGLTRMQAAELVRMPRPKLSNVLRGQLRGVSHARLIDCLTRLGSDVQIVVHPLQPSDAGPGRLSVRVLDEAPGSEEADGRPRVLARLEAGRRPA